MDNPGNTQPRRIHPLVATAAGAVIIASLAATAAITGLFPKASSNGAQTDQTQAAQVTSQPSQQVVDSAAPANPNTYAQQQQPQAQPTQAQAPADAQTQQPQPAPVAAAPTPAQAQYAQQQQQSGQYAQQPPPQPAYCASCGTVVAISAVRQEGHGTGVGAVGGAVVGGLVGNQFGGGVGRGAMTVLGAVGGGFAGNAVEKNIRSTTAYSVHVRLESGKNRYFTYHEAPPFQQGERVHIENGALVAG
ncbi:MULTISPECIES: glycine zipper 2TM domain-containing protein [Paraburkholderia]|jgi:outer membrane lipoprotein SlyB|uniref:Glycine zipper 2TM domain-containing protein n=1 Tax=Paraburkholderia phenazinium TaxID=60549 RepID=A0A1N6G328_9BURK|nr:glycine zipper 2TM domain-containing protein [Paraburkholderia phenazinium]SIO01900.1 Glycine zipper 2TM domain-containing protein [Paraburkholderia phenazinium]